MGNGSLARPKPRAPSGRASRRWVWHTPRQRRGNGVHAWLGKIDRYFPVRYGAWALHSIHNGLNSLSVLDIGAGCLGLIGSIVVDWAFVIVVLVIAALAVGKERRWIEQQLVEEVQVGRLTPDEYTMLTSSLRRIRARWQALTQGGLAAYHRLGRLQGLATELAFRKQQVLVDHDPAWSYYDIQLLRARIDALKGTLPAAAAQPRGTAY